MLNIQCEVCGLLYSACDLKAVQMNMQHNILQKFVLYKFKWPLRRESDPKICCAKGKGTFDLSTITKWLKKFFSGCKNIDNRAKSGKPKSKNSKAVF